MQASSIMGQRLQAFQPAAVRQQRGAHVQTTCKDSRIGKVPVPVPDKVTVTVNGQHVVVKGPKGELQRTFHPLVVLEREENLFRVKRADESRQAAQQHGLQRTLLSNMIMLGVGYRAAVAGNNLTLNVGYSNPVQMTIPQGLTVKVEKNTTIEVSGFDKELVGQFSANVRSKREPEPYKGKGVRYSDEVVLRKEGKRGK
ncbi:50S ribosomal protein L6 [Chlorella vulgaris]